MSDFDLPSFIRVESVRGKAHDWGRVRPILKTSLSAGPAGFPVNSRGDTEAHRRRDYETFQLGRLSHLANQDVDRINDSTT